MMHCMERSMNLRQLINIVNEKLSSMAAEIERQARIQQCCDLRLHQQYSAALAELDELELEYHNSR